MVYWRMKAGAHAAAHKHPQEQFVWVMRGAISLRIGTQERTIKPKDIAVIPGGVEHEAFFPEDTEVTDFFTPVREDFLSGGVPITWHRAEFARRPGPSGAVGDCRGGA
jgi:quercetin dioxygenase-like cupin family protein